MTPLPATPTCTHSDFWLAALCVTVWFLFAVVVGLVIRMGRLEQDLARLVRGMTWLTRVN